MPIGRDTSAGLWTVAGWPSSPVLWLQLWPPRAVTQEVRALAAVVRHALARSRLVPERRNSRPIIHRCQFVRFSRESYGFPLF